MQIAKKIDTKVLLYTLNNTFIIEENWYDLKKIIDIIFFYIIFHEKHFYVKDI